MNAYTLQTVDTHPWYFFFFISAECLFHGAGDVVSNICYGKQRCLFTVDQEHFRDPCPPGTKKYITVLYACGRNALISIKICVLEFFAWGFSMAWQILNQFPHWLRAWEKTNIYPFSHLRLLICPSVFFPSYKLQGRQKLFGNQNMEWAWHF